MLRPDSARQRFAYFASLAAFVTAGAVLAPAVGPVAAETAAPGAYAGMAVTVTKAVRQCFNDTVHVSGLIVPREEVLVRPDSEGMRIAQVLVEEGDSVVAGQVLARLSPPGAEAGQAGSRVALAAPVAGVVSRKAAILGTMASARADPLFRIIGRGELELEADIPAKYLTRITAGRPVKLEVVGVGELKGNVRYVSASLDPITQFGQARIFIGSDQRIRVGAFGRAVIDTGQSCGMAIPLSAILYGSDGAVVQVVRDDRVETRRVRIGLMSGSSAEIREGLSEGDVVVARAGAFLREGDRVRPMLADEAARR